MLGRVSFELHSKIDVNIKSFEFGKFYKCSTVNMYKRTGLQCMYSVAVSAIACQRAIMRLEKIIIVMLCLTGFHVLVQDILVFLSGGCTIFTIIGG
jgi:hypothetical protein